MSFVIRVPACSEVAFIVVSESRYRHICDIIKSADIDCTADIVIKVWICVRTHAEDRDAGSVIFLYALEK